MPSRIPLGFALDEFGSPVRVVELQAGDALKLPGALNEAPIVTLASAATVNIGAAAANTISISGTTTITAFDNIAAGAIRRLVFQGALTLTHNGASLILPKGVNITTGAGDVAEFVSLGSGNWRCTHFEFSSAARQRADIDVASKSGDTYSGAHDFGVSGSLRFTGSTGYGELRAVASTGGVKISAVGTSPGPQFIDVDGVIADGVSSLNARYFRVVNTTGACNFTFHKGNGTADTQHTVDGKGAVRLNRIDGETVIGGASSNGVDKLQVVGSASFSAAAKLGGFTLGTVPAASANTRGLIYISDLAGGAEPCFSDGTDWRRCSDRSIAS